MGVLVGRRVRVRVRSGRSSYVESAGSVEELNGKK